MSRNYAALPYEYKREMSALNDAEFGRLCRALIDYSETGTPIALCGNERFFAERVMMQEDRFRGSYEDISNQRRDAGKAGARARWQTMANDGKRIANDGKHMANHSGDMASDGKNGNTKTDTKTNTLPSNDGKGSNTRARAVPPTVEEIAAYCRERGNTVDPEHFHAYYESNGWKVGKNPMKDWKAAVRTWERNGYGGNTHSGIRSDRTGQKESLTFYDVYKEMSEDDG